MKQFFYMLLFILVFSHCRNKVEYTSLPIPGKPAVPSVLKKEHDQFLETMTRISSFQDSTGRVAKKLYELMAYHFKEEEEYVLPPLGLLPAFAIGKIPEQTEKVIQLTERFKSNSAKMIAEHQMIKAYLDEMMLAGAKENHLEIPGFEQELQKHAAAEEEVFFPTAILIGEYLKLVK
jgi:hypothetical protein